MWLNLDMNNIETTFLRPACKLSLIVHSLMALFLLPRASCRQGRVNLPRHFQCTKMFSNQDSFSNPSACVQFLVEEFKLISNSNRRVAWKKP